jgi:hypothetical protein
MTAHKTSSAQTGHPPKGWASSATDATLPEIRTLVFSEIALVPEFRWARNYVVWWVRNPDAGSRFEKVSQALRPLDDDAVTRVILEQGYDGLLFVDQDQVIGHSFFQKHADALYIFSYWIKKGPRTHLSAASYMTFFKWAKTRGNATWVKLGNSYAEGAWRILTYLQNRYGRIGLEYTGDGWVCLQPEKAHLPTPCPDPRISGLEQASD